MTMPCALTAPQKPNTVAADVRPALAAAWAVVLMADAAELPAIVA